MAKISMRGVPGLLGGMLVHDSDDDSREVINYEGSQLLLFDRNLSVHQFGKQVGHIASSPASGTWVYTPLEGEKFDTGVQVRDHLWTNLELAEVAVAQHVLAARSQDTSPA